GKCFSCHGEGGKWIERRVLSEKEQKQRERAKARREEKRKAKQDEIKEQNNIRFKESLGLHISDRIYVVDLKDTYSIKDELRALGEAKFKGEIGWYFTNKMDKFPTVELLEEEVIEVNEYGVL